MATPICRNRAWASSKELNAVASWATSLANVGLQRSQTPNNTKPK
jgi:hypothetical protein